ncbi:MAG: hypothetical protein WAW86_07240 [Gammaproteobacteria bacterium]
MASNRPQDAKDVKDDGYFLCLEIIKEIQDLDLAIKSFLENKSDFTAAQIRQLSNVANDLLAGIADQLPEFSKNLVELKKEIASQESKKAPKEFEAIKKELVKGLKELYKMTTTSYTNLEGLYKTTLKIHKDMEAKLEKVLKSLNTSSSTLFSAGKDTKAESKKVGVKLKS